MIKDNKGVLLGVGAYLSWGFFPVYFKALQVVPALEILVHRVVWSFLFLVVLVLARRNWRGLKSAAFTPRVLGIYTIAAVILALNWLIYVWGVNSGQIIETSLGYFINPLLSVALGVVLLREKLRPMQWLPVGLATLGVLYLTLQYGSLPWIAVGLALTFTLYGLIKKTAPLGALRGVTLETGILFIPSLVYLFFLESQGSASFGNAGVTTTLLLAMVGVVTALPLLMFASAARLIPLWLLGLLQYIAPTVQFLLGVFVYDEPFTQVQLVGFSIIWTALLLFTLEGFLHRRKRTLAAKA
jgi:chloramphenicol-sensitive protein RarD